MFQWVPSENFRLLILNVAILIHCQANDAQLSTTVAEQVCAQIPILFWGENCCVKLILNNFSLLCSDVFKELQKLNKSHISMCLHENYLDSAGWTGTNWTGITFLISEHYKPSPWQLPFYWKVGWWVKLREYYNFVWGMRGFFACCVWTSFCNMDVCRFVVKLVALYIRLCLECQTLIENHDQIKLLSNARNNLNTTLKVGAFNPSGIKLLVLTVLWTLM